MRVSLYWLIHNKEFIAKFTFGPDAYEEGKIQTAKCFQAPPPSHFIQATGEVIQEWMHPLCIWERSQQPGLRKEQYPSGLLAAKRLCPHPPVPQHQEEHAVLNFCTLRVICQVQLLVLNSVRLVNQNKKEKDWDLIFALDECKWKCPHHQVISDLRHEGGPLLRQVPRQACSFKLAQGLR